MQPGEHVRQSLVAAAQAPKVRQPAEAALGHPASGQQHKALPDLWQFDHLKIDTLFLGLLPGIDTPAYDALPSLAPWVGVSLGAKC